jgi:NADH-quinone oxidoreductase subunit N
VVLVRLVVAALPGLETVGWQLALAVSLVTMTLGNVMALWQTNVRRLLAYSSIAHAGYLLIGLAVGLASRSPAALAASSSAAPPGAVDGVGAMLFYLVVYALATAGSFAAFAYLGRGRHELDEIHELAGLGRSQPTVAAAVAVFMFSLAGIPPLAGFWGKLTLLAGALGRYQQGDLPANWSYSQPWFLVLAIVGAVNAAIAAAYYLRVVGVMYFRPPTAETEPPRGGIGALAAALACAGLVVAVGLFPGPAIERTNAASQSALSPVSWQADGPAPRNPATHNPATPDPLCQHQ